MDFHEPGFAAGVAAENAFTQDRGFDFQLSGVDRRRAKDGGGPGNPQALNRYSYVLNNPLRYTDPTGHERRCDYPQENCGYVANYSSHAVIIYGDRRIAGCDADEDRCFEYVSVILHPGEDSAMYGFVDVDFIQAYGALIDGHDGSERYKISDLTYVILYDDPDDPSQVRIDHQVLEEFHLYNFLRWIQGKPPVEAGGWEPAQPLPPFLTGDEYCPRGC